jgi:hypothetical protein
MKVMMPGEDVVARYACRSDGSKHPPRICRAASRACCTGTSSREINDHTGPRWLSMRVHHEGDYSLAQDENLSFRGATGALTQRRRLDL